MIRRPPRSTLSSSSAASDVYKRQRHSGSTGELTGANHDGYRLTWSALQLLACKAQVLARSAQATICSAHSVGIETTASKGCDGVKTVELGSTGTQVSQLALGSMLMGTSTDEATSVRILDDFVAEGGTLVDTANCYAWWHSSESSGHESEELLGRWFF